MRNHSEIKIKINNDMNDDKISSMIEDLFLLGFCTTSVNFPVASSNSGMSLNQIVVNDIKNKTFDFCMKSTDKITNYKSSTKSSEFIDVIVNKRKYGLEKLFDIGLLLEDENFDLLADKVNFKFSYSNKKDKHVIASMANLAFRYGMSVTKFEGNIIADENFSGNIIKFECKGNPAIELNRENDRLKISIFGTGEKLEEFINKLCQEFPEINYNYSWNDCLEDIIDSFKLKNYDGQKSYAKYLDNKYTGKVIAGIDLNNKKIENKNDKIEFRNYKNEELVCSKNFDIEWEVDSLKNNFSEFLKTNTSSAIIVEAAISENKEVRSDLENWIKKEAKKNNIEVKSNIICSYKPGYSWIEENIIPKLKELDVYNIDIFFKPCLADENKEWSMKEASALPSYHNYGTDDEHNWYDMPIRFLQELYPIDDIIQSELNISKNHIEFKKKTDKLSENTYKLIAYDKSGKEIFMDEYNVETYEIPYISKFEEMGCVHPSTGYMKISNLNDEIYKVQLKTDVDKIWHIIQNDVLEYVDSYLNVKCEKNTNHFSRPLFSKLEFDIEVSEPNYRIGCREDMISTLDGLHEDIYFVMSDYFQNYGRVNFGTPFDSPGLILPKIKDKVGKPTFNVKMYKNTYDNPYYRVNNNKIQIDDIMNSNPEIYIDRIEYIDDKLNYNLNIQNVDEEFVKEYFDLLCDSKLHIKNNFNFNGIIKSEEFTKRSIECIKICKKENTFEENLEILNKINFRKKEIIGYQQHIEIINELKKVSGIEVYEVAESYQGRKIYAIDFLSSKESGYCSRVKQITFNPSQFINCRHHANEVSSTNAAYDIIFDLLSKKENHKIMDNINLTIMPLENVDGAELHYELQKENPNWKLHVSRFNSLGREFFYDIFDRDTIHVEAKGFRKIYEKWLPDLIVDNHGVPSHEWEQQFSGYTSPSFKGFWLPRSILYGYFWPPKEEKFSGNKILCEKIQDEVSEAISKEAILKNLNLEWAERFEKYAHKWMPNLFPANYYNNMIFYWIEREYSQEQKYVSHKFPWITTAFFTSEVADETAQGDYLETCSFAHYCHNMAILNLMAKSNSFYEVEYETNVENEKNKINKLINLTRHRPIIV